MTGSGGIAAVSAGIAEALIATAAYIDLNPVRAGIVDDPKDYRWCSYGEAVAKVKRSREGLQRVMFEAGAAQAGELMAEIVAGL